MINKDLEEILREKLNSFTEPVEADLWSGIESRLDKAHRAKVIRWVSLSSVAVAASLLVALFVFKDSPQNGIQTSTTVAEVIEEPQTLSTEPQTLPVEPISEQIKRLPSSSVAEKVVVRKEKQSVPVNQKTAIQEESVSDPVPAKAVATEEVPANKEVIVESPKEQQAEQPSEDKAAVKEITLDEYLSKLEADERHSQQRHTSLSILSNISSVASEGSFIAEFGPAHSSSQSGEIPSGGYVEPISESPKFYLPVSFGVQFKTAIFKDLYIGAGIRYTHLMTQYDALVNKVRYNGIYSELHYLGIPINLYYNFVNTDRLGVYASLGGALDKCISSRYVFGTNPNHDERVSVSGLQYSANIGIGVEYWFLKRLGLYLDPSLSYYFDNNQPLSIRTAQPLQFNAELGLRFKF